MADDIKCLISLYICSKSVHIKEIVKKNRKEYKRKRKTKEDVASKIITK